MLYSLYEATSQLVNSDVNFVFGIKLCNYHDYTIIKNQYYQRCFASNYFAI